MGKTQQTNRQYEGIAPTPAKTQQAQNVPAKPSRELDGHIAPKGREPEVRSPMLNDVGRQPSAANPALGVDADPPLIGASKTNDATPGQYAAVLGLGGFNGNRPDYMQDEIDEAMSRRKQNTDGLEEEDRRVDLKNLDAAFA